MKTNAILLSGLSLVILAAAVMGQRRSVPVSGSVSPGAGQRSIFDYFNPSTSVPYQAAQNTGASDNLLFNFDPVLYQRNDDLLGVNYLMETLNNPGAEYPSGAVHYAEAIHRAEVKYNIPQGLLYRLIEKESAFNPRAFNSKVGASGIAQIVPRWHPGVNVWNPFESIDYAGKYLQQNYARFGDWGLALAAYNWGGTNVAKTEQNLAYYPAETRNYVTTILGRSGVDSVLV